jgi:hypothetical protein
VSAPLVDPTGFLLTTIRDDAGVAALTSRVRMNEPMPRQVTPAGVETDAGDARGPGKYVRFVVLARLARIRLRRAPVQGVRYVARCYGQGGNPWQDADNLAAAVSNAVHDLGHRISAGGVSVFGAYDDGGEGPVKDPDTGQPHSDIVIELGASTSLVPVVV